LFLVVADGEGVHGGNGATGNQMGHFFRDTLGASTAMGLDSGLSTELLIRTASGLHRVNTITGEDAGIQVNPYTGVLSTEPGGIGSVGYYIAVGGEVTAVPLANPAAAAFSVRVRWSLGSPLFQFDLTLPTASITELKLYDVAGRQVAVAFRGELKAGAHTIPWRGTDGDGRLLGSGVYYYRLTAGSRKVTGSVVVLR
jgi:hypothetical protein